MKYSVVNSKVSPPRVLLTYPFQWMAVAMAAVYGGEKRGFDIAITPTDPQEFITVCEHRDELAAKLQETLDHLMTIVARGDSGKWVTLFPEEYELGDEMQDLLDRATAA